LGTDPRPALCLAGINTLYGDSHVLHEVAFSLAPGRLLALLGRNGAGKTTCMSTIIGFAPPRDGSVALFGEPVTRLAPETISHKGVALVPQGRRIFASLSVRENLLVARQERKGAERPWTLERVLDAFPRLAERLTQVAGSLSGGEQQMLAIGRALMSNPRVLLMDEPSRGIDIGAKADVFRTMRTLAAQGLGIVFVTSDLDEVLALHAAGRTKVIYETRELGKVNEAFDEVLQGRARARLVFDLAQGVHG